MINISFTVDHQNFCKYEPLKATPMPLECSNDIFVYETICLDGFFIEAGGQDFERESTSLYFELKHNWTVSYTKRL